MTMRQRKHRLARRIVPRMRWVCYRCADEVRPIRLDQGVTVYVLHPKWRWEWS